MATEEDLRRKAEDIADQATSGYEKILPPHVIVEMKRLLILDMMCTDEGRAQLRRCLGDRAMAKSGEASDEPSADERAPRKDGTGAK
ncbi:MAG: hypothetical protein U0414_04840 [Polyangiaceae bacterium]